MTIHRPGAAKFWLTLHLVAVSAVTQGCVQEESLSNTATSSSSSTGSGSGSGSSGTPSFTGGVYLNLSAAWESTPSDFESIGTCSVPVGSAAGTTATCALSVPEGKLFFSRLKMTAGTSDTSTCKIIVFTPYYYLMSNLAGFQAPWQDSATDCSASPTPADCYNGVGTEVMDVTSVSALYSDTANTPEITETASSANSAGRMSGVGLHANRWGANGLAAANEGIAQAGSYVASSMVNYAAYCYDEWMDLQYSVTIKLNDEDTNGGENPALDFFSDWDP